MTMRRTLVGILLAGGLLTAATGVGLARLEETTTTSHATSINLSDLDSYKSPAADASQHSELVVAIDGVKNPELIPDEIAYRHLLAATSPSETFSEKEKLAVQARIAKIGLGEKDVKFYRDTLAALRVRDELTRIAQNRKSFNLAAEQRSPSVAANLRILRDQEDNVLRDAKEQVTQGLTKEGLATLDNYVQTNVKRHVRILRGGHMGAMK